MADDFLGERKKALEESFFKKHNEMLRDKLRAKETRLASKQALAAASGLDNDDVLEKLVDLGISGETFAALSLYPLVAVAWASGRVEAKERKAVLAAAREAGLSSGDVSYQLLEGWLDERPTRKLLEAWKDSMGALSGSLTAADRAGLRREVMDRARRVAEAAGGFLGLSTVSREEEAVLKELEGAFS
jgi:hypothetical protein